MDEQSELNESKSYWCTKLIDAIEPCVFKKFKQIFEETVMICNETKETLLYLKAFQNALSCIPEWSNTMITKECANIAEISKCDHLKELIATVHVVQLKIVTNMRPSNKPHSVRLSVPDTDVFIHNVYINVARELWKATFLFSREVDLVKQQENNYEIRKIIRRVIYKTIQDNIPADTMMLSYLTEDVEEDEEVIIEPIHEPEDEPDSVPAYTPPPSESVYSGPSPFDQTQSGSVYSGSPSSDLLPSAPPPLSTLLPPAVPSTSKLQWNDDHLTGTAIPSQTISIAPANNPTFPYPDLDSSNPVPDAPSASSIPPPMSTDLFELDIETL